MSSDRQGISYVEVEVFVAAAGEYFRRARAGECIIITAQGEPIYEVSSERQTSAATRNNFRKGHLVWRKNNFYLLINSTMSD